MCLYSQPPFFLPISTYKCNIVEVLHTDDARIVLQATDSNFGMDKQELKTDANNDGVHNFRLRFDPKDIPQGELKSAVLCVSPNMTTIQLTNIISPSSPRQQYL